MCWGHLGSMFLNNQRIHRSWIFTNLDWDQFVAETHWLHLTVPLTSVQTIFLQCTSMLWVRVFHSIFAQAATARFAFFVLISLLQWSRMRIHGARTVVYWWSWRWDWVSHDMVSPFPQTMFGESWKAWTGWCTLRQTYTDFGLVEGQTYFFLLSLFWSLLHCPHWWKVKRSQTTTGSNEPDLPWRNRIYILYSISKSMGNPWEQFLPVPKSILIPHPYIPTVPSPGKWNIQGTFLRLLVSSFSLQLVQQRLPAVAVAQEVALKQKLHTRSPGSSKYVKRIWNRNIQNGWQNME